MLSRLMVCFYLLNIILIRLAHSPSPEGGFLFCVELAIFSYPITRIA